MGILFGLLMLSLLIGSPGFSAEPESASPPSPGVEAAAPLGVETNFQQLQAAILLLEERLRSNQLALEVNQLELKREALHNAESVSNGFQAIERALSAQAEAFALRSAREMESVRSSNRVLLVVGGSFAAVTALAMLMVAYFQWRMSRVWMDISAALPVASGLGRGSATAMVEGANTRLLGAMEQLEKRVQAMENGSGPTAESQARGLLSGDNGDSPSGENGAAATVPDARIRALLREGQSLLKENKLEAALHCYDQVLAIAPDQTEALVKKGAALERLHKVSEAFECYDRAISADGSMTMAYLYKGGLCSRLERFREALECYEKALRTHDEGRG